MQSPPLGRFGFGTGAIRSAVLGPVTAIAVVACIGGELGRSSVQTDFSTTITLTSDRPVVSHSVDFEAKPGRQPVMGIDSYIELVGVGDAFNPGVWVSILNLETGDSVDQSDGIGNAAIEGGGHSAPCDGKPELDAGTFRDLPVAPCEARWTVIARWLDPKPGAEIPLALNAHMRAWATQLYPDDQPFTLDSLKVTDAGVPLPAEGPAATRGVLRGSTRLTPSSGRETHRSLLHVPRALLTGRSDDLRLGRMFVGIDLKERRPSISVQTDLSFGDIVVASAGAPTSMERDWLARCKTDSDCDLPITLTFGPRSASEVATMSPDGVVAFDWRLEARFEDFGRSGALQPELTLSES